MVGSVSEHGFRYGFVRERVSNCYPTAEEFFVVAPAIVESKTHHGFAWFEALALWKAAVFCEAIYGRYVRGELGTEDTRAAIFEVAVPLLAETALQTVS